MTAQELLKMIETVDPNDKAKLDEIDARVWCYINDREYFEHDDEKVWFYLGGIARTYVCYDNYTRSRDALKQIRPDGWHPSVWTYDGGSRCIISGYVGGVLYEFDSKILKTEELSELHAIIQAIEHERTKK